MKKCIVFWMIATFSLSAHADQLFGDFKRLPDDIERGFSVSADFGMFYITGDQSERRTASSPGFALALNLGVDIMEYLSIESINLLGINEASPADTALEGGVNTYMHQLALKLQYPLNRFYPFFEAGGGIFYSDPSFNFDSDSFKWNMVFGAGFEYYTFLRHYSLYVKYMYHVILDNPFNAWNFSGGIRYTF